MADEHHAQGILINYLDDSIVPSIPLLFLARNVVAGEDSLEATLMLNNKRATHQKPSTRLTGAFARLCRRPWFNGGPGFRGDLSRGTCGCSRSENARPQDARESNLLLFYDVARTMLWILVSDFSNMA
ncbi:hypothetical protein CBL_03646 [Carabus blaptoides fortunei]